MCKALFICIWLLGALLTVIVFANSARRDGQLSLMDLLIGIVTSLFSFFGIVFLALLRLCEIVADRFNNPVVWSRNDKE